MAVVSSQVQLNSSTATLIVAAANSNTVYTGQGTPRSVVLYNSDGSNDAYLGGPGVASGTGLKLTHGSYTTISIGESDAIYGLAAANTPTIHYMASGS